MTIINIFDQENFSIYLICMAQLQNYRDQIDQIDAELIELLAQRFKVVQKVWEYKKINNFPALQSARWQEVMNSKKKLAWEKWISPEFIETIWNEIHEYALNLEK